MPAPFLRRMTAFIIDYFMIVLYLGFIFIISYYFFPTIQLLFQGSLYQAQFFGFLLVTMPISVYFVIMDSKIGKQSFGKRICKIQVVNEKEQSLNVGHSIVRTTLKFIPWELSHFLVYRLIVIESDEISAYYFFTTTVYLLIFTYIFTAIFSRRKQSVYDMLTKTYVKKA